MARRYRILRPVPCIGVVNAAMLHAGTRLHRHRQAASLLGVAPFNRVAARRWGRGTSAEAVADRGDGLFLAALAATGWNPDMEVLDKRLTSSGKESQGRARGSFAR